MEFGLGSKVYQVEIGADQHGKLSSSERSRLEALARRKQMGEMKEAEAKANMKAGNLARGLNWDDEKGYVFHSYCSNDCGPYSCLRIIVLAIF